MIKNKLKIGLVFALVMMFGATSSVDALVVNTYSAATIIDLSSADFTISASSTDGGLVVNADSVVITTPAVAGTFTVTSATRGITISGSVTGVTVSQTCSSALLDTVTITFATGSSAGDLTLTPNSGQCTYSTGGGGGGGAPADTTPPTSTSISVADGAETTETTSVTLILGATGASYMMIANDVDFTDAEWETYATSKEWTLTTGDAEKTVYAKFKDSSNNVSTAVSDTITLTGTGEEEAVEEETAEEETGETTTPADTITPYSEVLDGDIVQCKTSSNPFAVYIVKVVGDTKYIRHIVSLEIFDYYSHLDWNNLKQVDSLTNYSLSGWARVNTGPNGTPGPTDKVYEINGDQTKHWINMTAEDFLAHGGSDAAIYSVNQGEMDLYTTGSDVMSL